MSLSIDEIRELRDKLEPLASPGGIQIFLPFQTNGIHLTAHAGTRDALVGMRRILEPYEKRLHRTDLWIAPDINVCMGFLGRIDWCKLRSALIQALRAEINALCSRDSGEPLYAFVVGVSPAHSGVEIFWNTPADWNQRVTDRRMAGATVRPSMKYNGPDFNGTMLSGDDPVWQDVRDILQRHEEVCSEFYSLTGAGGTFFQLCENRFYSTAAQALREVRDDLLKLSRTPEFVAYVQDYTGAGDPLFLALETVSEPLLRTVMPWLFPSFEGGLDS